MVYNTYIQYKVFFQSYNFIWTEFYVNKIIIDTSTWSNCVDMITFFRINFEIFGSNGFPYSQRIEKLKNQS